MDVREKLVGLIFGSLCRHIHKSCKLAENIADDLIANGVTVQEERRWIPASEPPKNSEHVLVCTKHRKPFKARYYPDRKRWDFSGSVVITHWMPLPEPPKEDV